MSNDSSSSSSASGGIGFAGLLTIVFIVLKLLHKITWSWVWVLSPMWIGASAAIAIVALVVGGAFAWTAISPKSRSSRRRYR